MISVRDKYYLIDTGFWIALISHKKGEEESIKAKKYYEGLRHKNVLIPWPTYYELFRDQFFNVHVDIKKFDNAMKGLKIRIIDDAVYKERALKITRENSNEKNKISLVDNIIKLIIEDKHIQIDALVTVNKSDFYKDCFKHRVRLDNLKDIKR